MQRYGIWASPRCTQRERERERERERAVIRAVSLTHQCAPAPIRGVCTTHQCVVVCTTHQCVMLLCTDCAAVRSRCFPQSAMQACDAAERPAVLVSVSAVGYYGVSETACYDEKSAAGADYLAQVRDGAMMRSVGTRALRKQEDTFRSSCNASALAGVRELGGGGGQGGGAAHGGAAARHRAGQRRGRHGEDVAHLSAGRRWASGRRQAVVLVDPPRRRRVHARGGHRQPAVGGACKCGAHTKRGRWRSLARPFRDARRFPSTRL
jgi:hypothetical protein